MRTNTDVGISFYYSWKDDVVRVFLQGLPANASTGEPGDQLIWKLMGDRYEIALGWFDPIKVGLPGDPVMCSRMKRVSYGPRPADVDHVMPLGEFIHRLTS